MGLSVCLCRLVSQVHVECLEIRRMGSFDDGGYDVCTAPPYNFSTQSSCLVYSFGSAFLCLFVCLPESLSFCLSLCPSACLLKCLSLCLPVFSLVCLCVCLYVSAFISSRLTLFLFNYYLSVCSYVSLSLHCYSIHVSCFVSLNAVVC